MVQSTDQQQLAAQPEQLDAARDSIHLPDQIFDVQRTRIITPDGHSFSTGTAVDHAKFETLEQMILDSWDRKGKKPIRLLPDAGRAMVSHGGAWYKLPQPEFAS
jgi:hypothetical protein